LFEYFSDNPTWNFSIALSLLGGGNIHEIDQYCRSLKERSSEPTDAAQEAWRETWEILGKKLEKQGKTDEKEGHLLSAGRKYLSAANYYIIAERQLNNQNPKKLETYKKALRFFKKGIQLQGKPVEFIDIPYDNTSLPGIFVPAEGVKKAPCMIHFGGADSTKETLFFATSDIYSRRGVSLLIVDNPGNGEALRLRKLYSGPETEKPAGACVDYLETRKDVDRNRIGIVALSLGGYYAPRAAAFEKRLKCCVAWGASWDFGYLVEKMVSGEFKDEHLINFQFAWLTGKKTAEDVLKVARQMTLEGVVDKITCPLLVVHGECDRLLPVSVAEKTINGAINSPNRKLKIFTIEEGGVEHCQADNNTLAVEYIADWVADIFNKK
jgi:dienelactone hydrolase